MEFQAREDIEAPLDHVFGEITDFASFERSIMRRGGDVTRLEGPVPPAIGAAWEVKFRLRGKDRTVVATLVEANPDHGITLDFDSANLKGSCAVELVPLSRSRTRLNVTISAQPKTLPVRLLFQSMRFGKHRMTQRFKAMVLTFAEDAEARYRAGV